MISSAGFLYFGWMSTGMPRPSSLTDTVRPSAAKTTSTFFANPLIASSIELSTISQSRWWYPCESVPPMYIAGRFRTGSSPSRTSMSLAL